jgi:hypothetical protein
MIKTDKTQEDPRLKNQINSCMGQKQSRKAKKRLGSKCCQNKLLKMREAHGIFHEVE